MDRKQIDRDMRALAKLEAMLSVKPEIAEKGYGTIADVVRKIEDMAIEIALPMEQPPAFARQLIKDRGLEDFAVHDFSPAEAPTNGPYLDAIWQREAERRRKKGD